jgi:hypothetical protein
MNENIHNGRATLAMPNDGAVVNREERFLVAVFDHDERVRGKMWSAHKLLNNSITATKMIRWVEYHKIRRMEVSKTQVLVYV